MKKLICSIMVILTVIGLMGCSSEVKDTEALRLQQEIQYLNKEMEKLTRNVSETNMELDNLKNLIPEQSVGEYSVIASKLNMRQDASSELDTIGIIDYGTKINVIDTSNPLWYKVSLDVNKYTREDKESKTVFKGNNGIVEVKNDYLDLTGSFYVSSLYLSFKEVEAIQEVPEGDRPFVYGLNFYDNQIAALLAAEIWRTMQGDLTALGYTGVKVVYMNRETYGDDVKNGVYDAVESAPGQFATVNKETEYMQAFAKNVIGGETSYRGIIVINKDSGITDAKKLKGKKVLTGKEYSESGYRYQKYYLEEVYGIDIEKDLKLETDYYHQEVFYKVATGEAPIGFCGDFVMTNSFGEMKTSLAISKIDLASKEELEQLRDNIIVLKMNELNPIPNNPHSVKSELAGDSTFVKRLYDAVKSVYSKNKENYDITEASNSEYKMLLDFE